MEILYFVIILALLTFASAYCSSAEIALFSLPTHKIKSFQHASDPRLQRIAALLRHPRDLLVTVFMLNTISNILLQNVASNLFGVDSSWAFKVGVPFILTLILGEIIPKYLGLRYNLSIAYAVTPTVDIVQKILSPVRKLTIAITTPISQILFGYLQKEKEIAREEIVHALKTASEQGIIETTEEEWASGYLDLLETNVKELVRPKEDVLFYDIHTPLNKLTHLFVEQQCSRIPVCDKDLDHVLGILHAVQFFTHRQQIDAGLPLSTLLKKPLFIPEVTGARTLLSRLYQQQEVIALAVDEYGSITGLITLEDIAEVVIGSISDYRDQKPLYTRASDDEIIASGRLELGELNELFDVDLDSSNMVTVGGWLTEQLDTIPKNGLTFEKEGLFFHVLTATPRRIQRLYIRKVHSHRKQPNIS
jgi:putative hemolysin